MFGDHNDVMRQEVGNEIPWKHATCVDASLVTMHPLSTA